MSCYDCDQYNQCTKSKNCLNHRPSFTFCHKDNSPQQEVVSDFFYFIGFALILTVICLIAGIGWGLFERYYPSTVCMILQALSFTCK
jgi:hypothetical protein